MKGFIALVVGFVLGLILDGILGLVGSGNTTAFGMAVLVWIVYQWNKDRKYVRNLSGGNRDDSYLGDGE